MRKGLTLSSLFSLIRNFLIVGCLLVGLSAARVATAATEQPIKIATMKELLAMSFEELLEVKVITSTGTPKSVKFVPSVATVITASDIERMGAKTLDEVLETVPGFHVQPSAINGFTSNWSIRGFSADPNPYVLLLINGHPLTNIYSGTQATGYRLSTAMISSIEIIRGPGSAVHGADAVAGIVNVITKNGKEIDGTRAAALAGSFDTFGALLQHGRDYNGWNVVASLEWQKSEGDDSRIVERDPLGSGPPSLAPTQLDTRRELIEGHLGLAKGNLSARVYGALIDHALGVSGFHNLNYSSDADTRQFLGDITYKNSELVSGWEIQANLYGYYSFTDAFIRYYPEGSTNMLGNPYYKEKHCGFESIAVYRGVSDHTVRLGGGGRYFDFDSDQYRNFGPGVSVQYGDMVHVKDTPYIFIDNQYRRLWYGLLQDEWRFARKWELTAGLRYDHYNDFGNTTNPRLALVWQTNDRLTSKILYGRAFRPPTLGGLYFRSNPVALGNPDLEPEKIDTAELVFDGRPADKLRTSCNLFYYDLKGNMQHIPDPAPATTKTMQNAYGQTGYGFELEMDWQAMDTIRLKADFAYQHSRIEDNNNQEHLTIDAPGMKFHLNPQWRFMADWLLDTHFYWVADRHRALGDARPAIKDYELVNLAVTRVNLFKYWDLALTVHNLFDEDVREPSDGKLPDDYPMESRSAWVSLLARF